MGTRKQQHSPGWRWIENLDIPGDVLAAGKAECRRVCAGRERETGRPWRPCVDLGHLCVRCENIGRSTAKVHSRP